MEHRHLILAALLVLLAGAVGGCKGNAASGGGGGAGADPSDLPGSIPFYPGARVVSSKLTTGPSGRPARTVVITTKDPEAKVRAFYAPSEMKDLPSKGGDGTPGSGFWYYDEGKKLDVRVSVAAGGDGANVTIVSNVM